MDTHSIRLLAAQRFERLAADARPSPHRRPFWRRPDIVVAPVATRPAGEAKLRPGHSTL